MYTTSCKPCDSKKMPALDYEFVILSFNKFCLTKFTSKVDYAMEKFD